MQQERLNEGRGTPDEHAPEKQKSRQSMESALV